jgi:hypothetical protein
LFVEMAEEKAREMAAEMAERMAEKSRAEGRVEGGLLVTRDLCAEAVGRYHPALASRAARGIEACMDVKQLRGWILRAPETSDEEFSRLLGLSPRRRTTARAKAGPARRAARVTRKKR